MMRRSKAEILRRELAHNLHPLLDPRARARWSNLSVSQTARVRDEVAAWLRGPGWARLSEVGSRLMQVALPDDPPVEHQLAVALASLALHSRALMVLDEGWLNILSSILARYSLTGNTRPRVETPVCLEDVRGHLQRLANDCASRVALVRRAGGW